MYSREKAALEIAKSIRPWQHQLNREQEALFRDHAQEIVDIAFARRDHHMAVIEERQAPDRDTMRTYQYVPLRPSVRMQKGTLSLRWLLRSGRTLVVKTDAGVEKVKSSHRGSVDWKRTKNFNAFRPADWRIPKSEFGKLLTTLDEDLVLETEEVFGLCRAAWAHLKQARLAHQSVAVRMELLVPYQTTAMDNRRF